jgi:hypothetical protein
LASLDYWALVIFACVSQGKNPRPLSDDASAVVRLSEVAVVVVVAVEWGLRWR